MTADADEIVSANAEVIAQANSDIAVITALTGGSEAALASARVSIKNENSADSNMKNTTDQISDKLAGDMAADNRNLNYVNYVTSESLSSGEQLSFHEQTETRLQDEIDALSMETQIVKDQAKADKLTAQDNSSLANTEMKQGDIKAAEQNLNEALQLDEAEGDSSNAEKAQQELNQLNKGT